MKTLFNLGSHLKISVVTVCYNAADTIEETMLSVLNQTYDNVEYIIIDGGSTDGTVDIIKKYADRLAYWVSEPDKGIYDAMNKGIDVATGDYIYFLGADDILFSESTLSECVTDFSEGTTQIYYGNVLFKDTKIVYPGEIKSVYSLCLRNFSHQGLFYPKSIYKEKRYDVSYRLWADYVYNLELFKSHKFYYVNRIIAVFNRGGIGSVSKDEKFMANRIKLIRELFGTKVATIIRIRHILSSIYHGLQHIRK